MTKKKKKDMHTSEIEIQFEVHINGRTFNLFPWEQTPPQRADSPRKGCVRHENRKSRKKSFFFFCKKAKKNDSLPLHLTCHEQ